MKEKYIILRSVGSSMGALDVPAPMVRGLESMPAPPASLRVEVENVDRRELAGIVRNSDVRAVAPAMPLKLFEPKESTPVAAPAAGTVSWGIQAVKADTSPFTGSGMVVAVLDTGIARNHSAFPTAGLDIVEKDFTGTGNGDTHGHGTHCAGTIFGRDVGGQRIGVARGVNKALIGKVLGGNGGGSDTLVRAIMWAHENGAHIISMSLGIDFPGFVASLVANGWPAALATSKALDAYRLNVMLFERVASLLRANAAFTQPCMVIAAAGNESERDKDPDFEIHVSPPAVSEGNISVGALAKGGAGGMVIADFSNTGATLSAPGVAIESARHDQTDGLRSMSGTSMATPHVAGVAALWGEKLSAIGQFNPGTWGARVIASSVSTGLAAPFDPVDVGAGLVQSPQA
jgi:subtilisin family serine protease